MEGTDWPVCAAVYCVGMPGSLNTVVQLLGRAMRPKGEDYPEQHKDRAQLVFFVPCGGGSTLADLSIDHSRHALLTCCFLADHEVGQEWIVLRQVHRGIEDALGPREQNPAAADAENEANEPLAPEVRSEIELSLASAREQIISEGREPTLGEVVRQAMQARSDLSEGAFRQVATEILTAQPEEGAKVGGVIRQEIARRLRIHPEVKKAMEEAFAVVLEEFRDATLRESVVLESVGRQVHGVTGSQMRAFAERLRDVAPRLLTEKQVLAWADLHFSRIGVWPKTESGVVLEEPDENWANINAALRNGHRGFPGGSSLAQFLAERRGVRNQKELPPLREEQILEWADQHYERTHEWPGLQSGNIFGISGETWRRVDNALRLGLRSLPEGSSLAEILARCRGKRYNQQLPQLTEQQILIWADEHYQRTGEWPKVKADEIPGTNGETWTGVNAALSRGFRGLPGGSSLARFIAEHRGVRTHARLPPLTEEQILGWADEHYQRTGEWPKISSGQIPENSGEVWASINNALRRGGRGLPGGSSLPQLLEKARGARNSMNPPPLSTEQILDWAEAHYQRTGEWPNQYSGPVEEQPGETWCGVNRALREGSRGLAGGSSLARLLESLCGVRHRTRPPVLTIEQILNWADAHYGRTGEWPTPNSGDIPDSGGETWSGLQNALSHGHRGLQGGLSLAKLLKEKRSVRNSKDLPPLSEPQIYEWAVSHFTRTGQWPRKDAGPIHGASGETWNAVQIALLRGRRGLPGGSSLARLIREHQGTPVE